MPELPEVEALADHLRRHAGGSARRTCRRLGILRALDASIRPWSALYGQTVTGANRWGKYLGLQVGELHLITHLSRAGWLRWSDSLRGPRRKPAGTDRAARPTRNAR